MGLEPADDSFLEASHYGIDGMSLRSLHLAGLMTISRQRSNMISDYTRMFFFFA
jgi:hypothetical protein